MSEEKASLQGEKITENIWLCSDGVYRWTYEYNMLKNPSVIFTVWKVLGISVGIIFAFGLIFSILGGNIQGWGDVLGMGKIALIVSGIMLGLSIIGYLVLAAVYGNKYQVLFEMTEDYVSHIQMPKQFKKAEAIGWVTALAGLAGGKPGMIGVGLNTAARSTMTTELKYVSSLKIRRYRNTIHVNLKLDKNQVYAEKEDFDFVEQFLKAHCVNAKVS